MISNNWKKYLDQEFCKDYYKQLETYINDEYQNKTIYPLKQNVFRCFELCDFNNVKVIILGQDPYHEKNQAMGLAFSVPINSKIPPSLLNIYKELESDLKISINKNGDLTPWAQQGVLLLNTIMSVEQGKALSHKNKGWEIFTENIISYLNDDNKPKVFILWGNYAQEKEKLITNPKHFILKSVHPSPLSASRGFFGSRPFSKCNEFFEKNRIKPVDWKL